MKQLLITLLIVFITGCTAWSKNSDRTDNGLASEQLGRIYQTMLLKSKRSPSMGLSLAEYMASLQATTKNQVNDFMNSKLFLLLLIFFINSLYGYERWQMLSLLTTFRQPSLSSAAFCRQT